MGDFDWIRNRNKTNAALKQCKIPLQDKVLQHSPLDDCVEEANSIGDLTIWVFNLLTGPHKVQPLLNRPLMVRIGGTVQLGPKTFIRFSLNVEQERFPQNMMSTLFIFTYRRR
jgi:hypothetical protein